MGLAADSELPEVFAATIDDYVPTDTDLEVWVELDPAADDDIVTTKTGLFGADLTKFQENCAIATKNCDVVDFEKYSGWAIGMEWTAATASQAPPTGVDLRQAADEQCSSVVFEDQNLLVECYWSDTNELWNASLDDTVTADTVYDDYIWPDEASVTPFEGEWFGELQGLADKQQYSITFQEEGSDFYYEVGDTVTLWNFKDYLGGTDTDVTWASAARLTAAAGAIVASLLF